MSQLHWLPVPKRIEFKIATLSYQSVTFGQPTYLSSLLTPYQPHRSLRSVSQNLLTVRYHAAIAVLDKDHIPILHLESGMAYRLRSDSLLHWTALSAT